MNFDFNNTHQQRVLTPKACVSPGSTCRRIAPISRWPGREATIQHDDRAARIDSASVIGQRLRLLGNEEYWHGIGLLWAFTYPGPGPLKGLTFYVPAGSSFEFVASRWSEKQALSALND